ncbi:hypothetical protein HPB49_025520 [Dermacentor silvarum]|uniref:Uncharacterized protein n=1 Tax=Dermacentor silvarum TaxID=543639 RepID=A0ACB8D104_DERSI|nr:hypothetical protein HPB49_025520 [Dermacentor silvarum]
MNGAIKPCSGKSWASRIQRLDVYFALNDVSEDAKKRALFLGLYGADTFETVRALVVPKLPGEVSVTDLVTLFQRPFDR